MLQEWTDERPTKRSDCIDRPRPCPWVGCKHHLFIDVGTTGTISLNVGWVGVGQGRNRSTVERHAASLSLKHADVGRVEAELMKAFDQAAESGEPTCVLDMVEDGANHTLDAVGQRLGVIRERVRQIESGAIRKLQEATRRNTALATWEEGIDARHRSEMGG